MKPWLLTRNNMWAVMEDLPPLSREYNIVAVFKRYNGGRSGLPSNSAKYQRIHFIYTSIKR